MDGDITSYKYQQDQPFYLSIRKDFIHSECVIEFTGKILSDRYPELINRDNIRYCIEQIKALGICEIDTERLLQTAKVAKCDVTKDVSSTEIKEIISQTKQNLTNYDKWEVEKYDIPMAFACAIRLRLTDTRNVSVFTIRARN